MQNVCCVLTHESMLNGGLLVGLLYCAVVINQYILYLREKKPRIASKQDDKCEKWPLERVSLHSSNTWQNLPVHEWTQRSCVFQIAQVEFSTNHEWYECTPCGWNMHRSMHFTICNFETCNFLQFMSVLNQCVESFIIVFIWTQISKQRLWNNMVFVKRFLQGRPSQRGNYISLWNNMVFVKRFLQGRPSQTGNYIMPFLLAQIRILL